MKTIILIPSRMASTRLPGKPLLKVGGISIINHVYEKAVSSGIGSVFVATPDEEIKEDVCGDVVMTGEHESGTDRIFEAYQKLRKIGQSADYIINLQGDEPMIDVEDIKYLNEHTGDITTLACEVKIDEFLNTNIVKVITDNEFKAKDFKRDVSIFERRVAVPHLYQHIGIYKYKVSALEKFVKLEQSKNEIERKLEQMRAIDNNIDIDVVLTNSPSIGVDTKEDYLKIKRIMEV